MSTLMDELLFELPNYPHKKVVFDREAVRSRLEKIVDDDDLRRYIL
jgi:ATP-dependent protease HslVU (ClpYQ) ATPase subunit